MSDHEVSFFLINPRPEPWAGRDAFGIIVPDNSMAPTFRKGDYAVFSRTAKLQPDVYCIVDQGDGRYRFGRAAKNKGRGFVFLTVGPHGKEIEDVKGAYPIVWRRLGANHRQSPKNSRSEASTQHNGAN